MGIFTYLPYYLTGPTFQLPPIAPGLVYLLWLTGVISPFAGAVAARIGSRRVIAFTMGLGAVGLYDYARAGTTNSHHRVRLRHHWHVLHRSRSQSLFGRAGKDSQRNGSFDVPLAVLLRRQYWRGLSRICAVMGRLAWSSISLPGNGCNRSYF